MLLGYLCCTSVCTDLCVPMHPPMYITLVVLVVVMLVRTDSAADSTDPCSSLGVTRPEYVGKVSKSKDYVNNQLVYSCRSESNINTVCLALEGA